MCNLSGLTSELRYFFTHSESVQNGTSTLERELVFTYRATCVLFTQTDHFVSSNSMTDGVKHTSLQIKSTLSK